MNSWWRQRERQLLALALTGTAGLALLVYALRFQVLPQVAINLLDALPPPTASARLLVFSPHPDDETIAAGGLIARAQKNGAAVWVVLVTDGNRHGLENKRYSEFERALAELGVAPDHLIFLNYPDGQLKNQTPAELEGRFRTIIGQIKPTIIVFPHPRDSHPDHAATGRAVTKVTAGLAVTRYEYLVHHPRFPQPFGYAPNRYLLPPNDVITFDRTWVQLPLDTAAEAQKYRAVKMYTSQLRLPTLRRLLYGLVRQNELFAIPLGSTPLGSVS